MYNFFASLGIGMLNLVKELEKFFGILQDKKENRITISDKAPSVDTSELGDLWIDTSDDPYPPTYTKMVEIEVDCTIKSFDVSTCLLDVDGILSGSSTFGTKITVRQSLNGQWYGYLKAVYGSITVDHFLCGYINWIAVDKDDNVWFEALGDKVEEAKTVDVTFDEINETIHYDGIKDNLVVRKGFFNDYENNVKVGDYIKANFGREIPLTIKIVTDDEG